MMTTTDDDSGFDVERIQSWLAEAIGSPVSAVELSKLGGGHSSGAWLVQATTPAGGRHFVLKAPGLPSVVYRRDAYREAKLIEAIAAQGVAVPAVIAADSGMQVVGRPCFVMTYVDGRSVPDAEPAGYHAAGWFRDSDSAERRAIWDSFHDSLAQLHAIDVMRIPDAEPRGTRAVLDHWRAALLDIAPAAAVPRQVAALDWLSEHVPGDADEAPALCMGDARLVNSLFEGSEVRALVDFEVAYVGNPAADIGYSLFLDQMHRKNTDQPIEGLPTPEDTWRRWGNQTGRPIENRSYWYAFGATVICITATRAMIQWGIAEDTVESVNPLVADWEALMYNVVRS